MKAWNKKQLKRETNEKPKEEKTEIKKKTNEQSSNP